MLEFFKDEPHAPASAHRKFQRWRARHSDGFFLNVKSKKAISLHKALCTHSGDVRWSPSRNDRSSLTQRQKICSMSAQELLHYAVTTFNVLPKACEDCKPGETGARNPNGDSTGEELDSELEDNAAEAAIQQRTDISPTEKLNLVKSRRGQGVYRANLQQIERACRVTGIADPRLLRASHIKPWCKCDDHEKLDRFNGLLVSPHIDHLFDRGFISFSDTGDLLLSQQLNPTSLASWGIRLPHNVGSFMREQCVYLAYHRKHVFESTNNKVVEADREV